MSATDDIPVQESKTRERMTAARLAVARATSHIKFYPASTSTPLVTDMKTALSGLIEEIERR